MVKNRQATEWVKEKIKEFEGCRLKSYKDSGGKATIGYGHTRRVYYPGMFITQEQAEELLLEDIEVASAEVSNSTSGLHLTQGQFDACVDFVFNFGSPSFYGSTLLKLIKSGDYIGASKEFGSWNHCNGKILAGLTKRREAERKRFMEE